MANSGTRFEKARKQDGRSLGNHLGDDPYGATSMIHSVFAWRSRSVNKESETAKANRIVDELDDCFEPTLKSK